MVRNEVAQMQRSFKLAANGKAVSVIYDANRNALVAVTDR
jgi:hypothetical protein